MNSAIREAFDRTRDFSNKAFRAGCYAPWTSLYFNTLGNVIACCRNQSNVLGNVANESLDDIWFGDRLREMREHLRAYRFGGGCEFCGWMIESGDYQGAITHLFENVTVESAEPEWPKMMEFALSNTCNFACIQCCGDWSSTIRTQREHMPPLQNPYDDKFFSDLRRYLPHLELAKFYGGEPFIARESYRIWDMLIEDGLKPECSVLTNGSTWNKRVEKVLENLRFAVGISLDAVRKEALETIRVGAHYETVMANMARFREYTRSRGTGMMISFSWMRQNVEELGPMLLHCEEHGYEINVIRLVDPPQFSLYSLPPDELRSVADRLTAQEDRYLPHLTVHRKVWEEAVRSLYDNANERQASGYEEMRRVSEAQRRDDQTIAGELQRSGDFAGAIEHARRVGKQHKDYMHSLVTIAHSARRIGRFDEAESAINEAIGLAKKRPQLYTERAWLRFDQGRADEALADAEHGLSLINPAVADAEVQSQILHVLSFAAARLGNRERTDEAIDQWLALAGDQAWVRAECGRALADLQEFDRAIEQLAKAVELAGDDKDRLHQCSLDQARLYRRTGDFEQADRALAVVAKDSPDRVDLLIESAWLRFDQERFEACIDAAQHALRGAQEDTRVRADVGLVAAHGYAKLGAYSQAADSMADYVSVNPHDQRASRILDALRTQSSEQVALAFA